MAFKLVTDPDQMHALNQAGLLWWVSEKDGGKHAGIKTCVVNTRELWTQDVWRNAESNHERPCFGILLED